MNNINKLKSHVTTNLIAGGEKNKAKQDKDHAIKSLRVTGLEQINDAQMQAVKENFIKQPLSNRTCHKASSDWLPSPKIA